VVVVTLGHLWARKSRVDIEDWLWGTWEVRVFWLEEKFQESGPLKREVVGAFLGLGVEVVHTLGVVGAEVLLGVED
jgi:hypothetical protein